MYAALSYYCMRPYATGVYALCYECWGLKLLVYEALSYECMRLRCVFTSYATSVWGLKLLVHAELSY